MELVCAGMSGGSPEAVELEWTMPLYQGWLDHHEKWGPPAYVSVAAFLGLGGDQGKRRKLRAEEGSRGLPPKPDRSDEDETIEGPVPVSQDPEGFMRQFLAAGGQSR